MDKRLGAIAVAVLLALQGTAYAGSTGAEPGELYCPDSQYEVVRQMSEQQLVEAIFDNLFVESTLKAQKELVAGMNDGTTTERINEEFDNCVKSSDMLLNVLKKRFPSSARIEHLERLLGGYRQSKPAVQPTYSNL